MRLKKLESMLQETTARSEEINARYEEKSKYIRELESELCRLRRCNHNLRRQSIAQFVSRNIRVRWRLMRKRSTRRREKYGAASR